MRLEMRVTLWLMVLLGVAATLTLFGMARFEQQSLERQSTETGRLVAQATENSLEVSMLNNAPEDIQQAVRNLEEGARIESVSVYRGNGAVWVSSNPASRLEGPRRDALLSSMGTDTVVTSSLNGSLSVFVPVPKQPECVGCHAEQASVLGAVEVRMNERSFQQEFAQGARYSLFLAAVPLALGILFSVWAVRRSLLKPLAQIGDASARLGDGDLTVRLPDFKAWELSEVSSTFNDMAETLEQQAADLTGSVERLRSDLEGMEQIQAVLASGAGLGEILASAAARLGQALKATGVGVWREGSETPEAEWGEELPSHEEVKLAADRGPITSLGPLEQVPAEEAIAWIVAPARRKDATLGIVGVVWDPPRALDPARRDLLISLAGLVGVAVENADLLERLQKKEKSLQSLLRKTLAAQEEERRRISRELHDETSQVLSALMMNIDLLETQLEAQAPAEERSRARVEAVKALAEEAARNLDKMMLELRPALLDELGLIPALRWYLAQVSDLWDVAIEFEGGRMGRLPDHVEVAAFRIVQEAVANCVRHSNAPTVRVRVAAEKRRLIVTVADEGVGFDVAAVSAKARTGEAVGVTGMRERAELAGGSLDVESAPGHGTTVTAVVPLSETEGR